MIHKIAGAVLANVRKRSSLSRITALASCRMRDYFDVRFHARQQFPCAERLDQIIVRPRLHAFDAAFLARPRGKQNDRDFTQVRDRPASARSRPKPSSFGIITSDSTRSGGWPAPRPKPPRPSGTASTSKRSAQQAADIRAHVGIVIRPQDARFRRGVAICRAAGDGHRRIAQRLRLRQPAQALPPRTPRAPTAVDASDRDPRRSGSASRWPCPAE